MRAESSHKQTIHLDGKTFVLIERGEYDRLVTLAKAAGLPELPKADGDGNYPAVEYARASLARKIIGDRVKAGLTQRELADRAEIRVETLCRIEAGKNTPSIPTLDRIDRASTIALGGKRKKGRS